MRTSATVALAAALVSVLLLAHGDLATAKYIRGVGYNMMRAELPVPRQPHEVQFPPLDTRPIAPTAVKEAALICDRYVPVQRVVTCEVHTYDVCGNPSGVEFNSTQGWFVKVEEELHRGSNNRLVAPIVWLKRGVGRFYFTPLRIGPHRVTLTRRARPFNGDLRVKDYVVGAGLLVLVHDLAPRGLSHTLGKATKAVQRMLWAHASHRAEPSVLVPPVTPAPFVFEDQQHRYDDRNLGLLQEAIRRQPVQPGAIRTLPLQPARYDNNDFRFVDLLRPN